MTLTKYLKRKIGVGLLTSVIAGAPILAGAYDTLNKEAEEQNTEEGLERVLTKEQIDWDTQDGLPMGVTLESIDERRRNAEDNTKETEVIETKTLDQIEACENASRLFYYNNK